LNELKSELKSNISELKSEFKSDLNEIKFNLNELKEDVKQLQISNAEKVGIEKGYEKAKIEMAASK